MTNHTAPRTAPNRGEIMTQEQLNRLRELEELDSDGINLSASEYKELNTLLRIENESFVKRARTEAFNECAEIAKQYDDPVIYTRCKRLASND